MISTKRAAILLGEPDSEKRNQLIDKLTEEDAKYLLKACISVIRGEQPASSIRHP